jgi:arginyl-tRNA--protein-N-Asp/Glu arginylyltransferase
MRSDAIRLLKTLPHACGYYADRVAQNLVIDPLAAEIARVYESALTRGYRRAGGHIYRPACARCQACIPARIPVDDFRPDRSQRRNLRRNADLVIDEQPARFSDEAFALYARYLAGRHPGGGMDDSEREDFVRFLTSPWSPTRFLEFRRDGTLLAVAVTDVTRFGLSSVYTFYDPTLPQRGLGTFAILSQIEATRRLGLPHLYLGYWIAGHAKMDYKARFAPLELMRGARWERTPPPPHPSADEAAHA